MSFAFMLVLLIAAAVGAIVWIREASTRSG